MSRKVWIPLCTLATILFLALPVYAEDPDPTTCLDLDGKCYVSNKIHPNTTSATSPDGTAMGPWVVTNIEDDYATEPYRDAVAEAVYGGETENDEGYLAVIVCTAYGCRTTWYRFYFKDGQEAKKVWTDPGVPPEVGVSLPMPYLLGGGAFLGVLLVGTGVALRIRARHRRS